MHPGARPVRRTCWRAACRGVFAAGDLRAGSVKRIASAVGEGSICVQFVHRVLREFADAGNQSAIVAA
jgi:thioredoxin reductase